MAPMIPFGDSQFSLDISGVGGFFGGEVAVAAMATVHFYRGRRWLGWYNSPGSYEVAKRYGQLAQSRFWDGLYPGTGVTPAILFKYDGMRGPRFRGAHTGHILPQTGHLAHLLFQDCREFNMQENREVPYASPKRKTRTIDVAVVDLHHTPESGDHPRLSQNAISPLASIPILASIATSVACAVYRDWVCFSMVILGMVSSGLACFVIGTGRFTFTYPKYTETGAKGDGVLIGDSRIVVLRGTERAVTSITRGRFSFEFTGEPEYHHIGACSMLLTVQFLAQLLLVPQGKIFGQIMFLFSFAVSWVYNSYLSSFDTERFQRRLLREQILRMPSKRHYTFANPMSTAVFVLLALSPAEPLVLRGSLDDLLPNETEVWRRWKGEVIKKVCDPRFTSPGYGGQIFVYDESDNIFDQLQPSQKDLLRILFLDAKVAFYQYYQDYVQNVRFGRERERS